MLSKNDIFKLFKYLTFFFYFSAVYQFLCFVNNVSGFLGLRSAFYLSFIWLVPIVLFPKYTKIVSAFIGILLLITSLFSLGYFILYSQEFSQSVIFIIFESNMKESSEFFNTYFQWWMSIVFIGYIYVAFRLWKCLEPVSLNYKGRIFITLLSSFLFIMPFTKPYISKGKSYDYALTKQLNNMESSAPWNLIVGYMDYKEVLASMESLLLENSKIKPLSNLVSKDKDSTLVLVIGESTNRNRMSLYGYSRNTTPNLNKQKDDMVVFNNVYSPRPYTIEVLQQALTFANEKNPDEYLTKPNLLNIMKQAGYETYWITNQQTQTKRNTMLTTFSKMADHQVYLNNNKNQNSSSYDEVVIAPLNKALKDTKYHKKFIVVHLIGTHSKYAYRYPSKFSKFTDSKTAKKLNDSQTYKYNTYDNAVLYNDFVVSEIINSVSSVKNPAVMLYMSDHGEEVFDAEDRLVQGRNEASPTSAMYTIPFLIYANKEWKQRNDFEQLKNYTNRLYTSADLLFTYCDLAHFSFDEFDESRSIINKNFKQHSVFIGDPEKKSKLRDLVKEPF